MQQIPPVSLAHEIVSSVSSHRYLSGHSGLPSALNRTQERDDGTYPLWQWLAGLQPDNKYYNRIYEKSIAKTYSIQISDFTKELAKMLCTIHE